MVGLSLSMKTLYIELDCLTTPLAELQATLVRHHGQHNIERQFLSSERLTFPPHPSLNMPFKFATIKLNDGTEVRI